MKVKHWTQDWSDLFGALQDYEGFVWMFHNQNNCQLRVLSNRVFQKFKTNLFVLWTMSKRLALSSDQKQRSQGPTWLLKALGWPTESVGQNKIRWKVTLSLSLQGSLTDSDQFGDRRSIVSIDSHLTQPYRVNTKPICTNWLVIQVIHNFRNPLIEFEWFCNRELRLNFYRFKIIVLITLI